MKLFTHSRYGIAPSRIKGKLFQKTKNFIEKLRCGVHGDAIDRAHRIGPVTENEEGKNIQQIIVKFKSFKDHTTVYKNHKKAEKGARSRLNLTKRRLAILLAVRKLNREELEYAFADIDCKIKGRVEVQLAFCLKFDKI